MKILLGGLAIVLFAGLAGSPARAGAADQFAEIRKQAEALTNDCDLAFREVLGKMRPTPRVDDLRSLVSFGRVECEGAETDLWKVGRVTEAPLEARGVTDRWLSVLRQLAFFRGAASRAATKYIERREPIFLERFDNTVARSAELAALSRDLLTDAEAAIAAPPQKRRVVSLNAAARQDLTGFITRVQGLETRCEAASVKLHAAMEAPPNRDEVAILAPKAMVLCQEANKTLSKAGLPARLPKDVVDWLEDWVDNLAAVADKRTEAAKAAQAFADEGGGGHVEAFVQYKYGQWEKEFKAFDSLAEAKLSAGMKVVSSGR